ncbi:MAG: hypothetical protein H6683_08750 [Deltaproteobacteria bacterium]|nr:hypothetical protein [Deltaproteobacteria bacterium]
MTDNARRRNRLLAVALFAALTLAFFAPNLPHLSDAIIGHPDSDAYKHVWGQWWVVDNIVHHGRYPVTSDRMNFPDNGGFWCLDGFNALLTMPLRLVMAPITAFNLLVLMHVFLAAFFTYLFLRDLEVPWPGAVAGGAAFAFCPYMTAFPIGSGVAETQVIGLLPLYLLALRRAWLGSMRAAVAAGFLIVATGFACWSYGIYSGVITAGAIAGYFVFAWKDRARPADESRAPVDKKLAMRAVAFVVLAAVTALPLGLIVRGTVKGDDAVYARPLSVFPEGPKPWEEPALTSFALAEYVTPGEGGRHHDEFVDMLMYVAYPGLVVLALAMVGFVAARRRAWPYALGAGVFILLSLGPVILLTRGSPTGVYNPLYIALYYVMPLFNTTIHSVDRFAIGAALFLAIGAGFGVEVIAKRIPRARVAGVVAAVVIVAESAFVSPSIWPLPTSPEPSMEVAQYLRDQPGDFAVFDLPDVKEGTGLFPGEIFYWQIVHRRPIPYSLEGMAESVRYNALYNDVHNAVTNEDAPPADFDGAIRDLAAAGFGYVVLWGRWIPDDREDELHTMFEALLEPLTVIGDAWIYRVPGAVDPGPDWWK